MTPDQSKYFDDMETLFASDGWKNLSEDLQMRQQQEKEDAFTKRPNLADMQAAFGRNQVYEYLLSLESTLSEVKRQLREEVYE
jgi:hypothetical protein